MYKKHIAIINKATIKMLGCTSSNHFTFYCFDRVKLIKTGDNDRKKSYEKILSAQNDDKL